MINGNIIKNFYVISKRISFLLLAGIVASCILYYDICNGYTAHPNGDSITQNRPLHVPPPRAACSRMCVFLSRNESSPRRRRRRSFSKKLVRNISANYSMNVFLGKMYFHTDLFPSKMTTYIYLHTPMLILMNMMTLLLSTHR